MVLPYVLNTGTLFQTTVGATMPVRQRCIPRSPEYDKAVVVTAGSATIRRLAGG